MIGFADAAAKPNAPEAEPLFEISDEPLTPEQEAEVVRAEAYIAASGPLIPEEQVQAMLEARRRAEGG